MTIALAALRWRLVAVVAALFAMVGPLSTVPAQAAGPMTWQATVGYQSSGMSVQTNFYFPSSITIDEGDSVTWNLKSGEFHTVTFLAGNPAPPLLIFPGGIPTPNPEAFAPSGGDSVPGTGIVNSGIIAGPPGTSFTLKFPTAGTYKYNCLVHTPMKGWVTVQPAGTPYPHSQAFYNAQSSAAETTRVSQGYALAVIGLAKALAAGVGHVTAGIGQFFSTGSIAVVSFLPQVDIIHVGQTVTWNNRDPEFPHTVTFNFQTLDAQEGPFAFGGLMGDPTDMHSTSQDLNSGFLVAGGPTQFTVKFTAPGTYQYRCVLHDDLGMKGTVVVLPGS